MKSKQQFRPIVHEHGWADIQARKRFEANLHAAYLCIGMMCAAILAGMNWPF